MKLIRFFLDLLKIRLGLALKLEVKNITDLKLAVNIVLFVGDAIPLFRDPVVQLWHIVHIEISFTLVFIMSVCIKNRNIQFSLDVAPLATYFGVLNMIE